MSISISFQLTNQSRIKLRSQWWTSGNYFITWEKFSFQKNLHTKFRFFFKITAKFFRKSIKLFLRFVHNCYGGRRFQHCFLVVCFQNIQKCPKFRVNLGLLGNPTLSSRPEDFVWIKITHHLNSSYKTFPSSDFHLVSILVRFPFPIF